MSVYELGDFIFQNYYKPIGFSKGNSYYSMKRLKDLFLIANKLIEKIPHPCNAEKYYQSFVRQKNRRSVKQSEIITYQPKTFEKPNIVDIKSVITEHPHKTSHKLFKTIRQAQKVGPNSPLYSDTKKVKIF